MFLYQDLRSDVGGQEILSTWQHEQEDARIHPRQDNDASCACLPNSQHAEANSGCH